MDNDIANELNKLQEQRHAVNTETDLTEHCDALTGLDQRVGVLLDDIRELHIAVEERFGFMVDVWEQLEQPCKTLKRVDEALDLMIELNKLARICHRIDTCPYLVQTTAGRLDLKRPSLEEEGEDEENIDENDDKMTLQIVQGLLENFESTYSPLEDLLSKRLDLPYIAYATKVRNLQRVLSLQSTTKKAT